jgi:hypothetical protein
MTVGLKKRGKVIIAGNTCISFQHTNTFLNMLTPLPNEEAVFQKAFCTFRMAALLGTVSCNLTWVTAYKQVSLKQNISFHPACDLACNYNSLIMQMIKS